jgi:hypothetical protein
MMKNFCIACVALFLCTGLRAQFVAEIGSQFTKKELELSLFLRAPIKKGPMEILIHSFYGKEEKGNMVGGGFSYNHFHVGLLEGFSDQQFEKSSLISGFYAGYESEKFSCSFLGKYNKKLSFEAAIMTQVRESKHLSYFLGMQSRSSNIGPRVDIKFRSLSAQISPFTWNFDSKESGFFLGASWELQKKEK